MAKTKKFKKYSSEAISKLPSGKTLTAIAIAILLAVIFYVVILFLYI